MHTLTTGTRTALTTGLTALLVAGALAAAPAGANTASGTSDDGGSTLTVAASDLVLLHHRFGSDRFLLFTADVPDPYLNADGEIVSTTWSVTVEPTGRSGDATCPIFRPLEAITHDRDGNPLVSDRSFSLPYFDEGYLDGEYPSNWYEPGRCELSATLTATRAGDATHPAYSATTTVAAHHYLRVSSAVTVDAPRTVTKGTAFTVSGLATYQKPSAAFAYRPAPRLTKVTVEFRPAGSTTWKAIKATYVTGTAGRFATAVTVPGSGSLRTVVLTTPRILTSHSSARSVTVS